MQLTSVLLRLSLCWISSFAYFGCDAPPVSRKGASETTRDSSVTNDSQRLTDGSRVSPVVRLVNQQQKAYKRVEERTLSLGRSLDYLVPKIRERRLRRRAKRANKSTLREQRSSDARRRNRRARAKD
jgi:hypothetical protein